jgi:hypothetical protein
MTALERNAVTDSAEKKSACGAGIGQQLASDRTKARHTNDRFQRYSRHTPTAARRCAFPEAVARDLAALVGSRCMRHVSSSIG